jgi:hypothetical protein
MNLKETEREGADWIRVSQDGVQWWTLVSTVLDLGVL